MAGLTEPNQIGKREDLADIYSIVDMKSTPFITRVNKSPKPTNSKFEWVVDAYASPKVTGVVDGTDVADYENHAASRARLANYVQVFRRTKKVSRLSENLSDVAGVPSEIGLASAKGLIELKRDMETTVLQNGVDGQLDTGAVPYLTVTLGKWIDTTGPTTPVNMAAAPQSAYRPASAQIITTATASLDENTDVQNLLKAVYDATGMNGDFVLYVGSTLRRRFTDMTRTVTGTGSTAKPRSFNVDQSNGTITASTTVYEGDYGTITLESDNFIGNDYSTAGNTGKNVGYLLDMDKIHLRQLKSPGRESFDDQGGGPRIMIEAVAGLQVDNPIGLGKFAPTA